jgi:hypothetical protein
MSVLKDEDVFNTKDKMNELFDSGVFTVSQNTQFYIALTLTIIISVYYFFSDTENKNDMYIKGFDWFFFICVINLINIILVIYYYNTKTKTFKGIQGPRGNKGKKGERGIFSVCSDCDNTINLNKRSEYVGDFIVSFPIQYKKNYKGNKEGNKGEEEKEEGEEEGNKGGEEVNNELDNNFDDFFIKDIRNLNIVTKIKYLNYVGIVNTIDKLVYTNTCKKNLYHNFFINNLNKMINDEIFYEFGSFQRVAPIWVKSEETSYNRMGDVAFKGSLSEKNDLNSFVASGIHSISIDPVLNDEYEEVIKIEGYSSKGNYKKNKKELYSLLKPINRMDMKGLGYLAHRKSEPITTNMMLYFNNKCLKEVSQDSLELSYIYYGYLGTDDELLSCSTKKTPDLMEKISLMTNYQLNNKIDEERMGLEKSYSFFSVWRTPLNTFEINKSDVVNIKDGVIAEFIYDYSPKIYNQNGLVTTKYIQELEKKFNSYSVPRKMVEYFVYANFFIQMVEKINYNISKKEREFKKIKMDDKLNLNEKITKLLQKEILKEFIIKYNNLEKKINSIKTMLELVAELFPSEGLNEEVILLPDSIKGLNLTDIQIELILMLKVFLPPNVPVYILSEECISTDDTRFYNIERRKIIMKLNNEIKTFKRLKHHLVNTKNDCVIDINDPSYDNYNQVRKSFNKKIGTLVHYISNYEKKIQQNKFDEFTTGKLNYIYKLYKEYNKSVIKVCNIKK